MGKKQLLEKFQKNPYKYWKVKLFDDGWKRYRCRNCGKYFWSLVEQDLCNDSSCRSYDFIGKKLMKKKFDYFQAMKAIKKFFEKNDHVYLERNPVMARWFPIPFVLAGVVNFYRMDGNEFTFESPHDKVIQFQPSLRFNDIPQVGVTGRHWTCHTHVEQFAMYDGKKKGYWKDKCIQLDYDLLTKVFGIKPEKINFVEDAWLGPGAFGYSLESFVAGLELGNAVFTEYSGTPENYKLMNNKVIDMGAGLERFCWMSQGNSSSYDAVLGKVIDKMKRKAGINYDKKFFQKYAKLTGILNLDEVDDIEYSRREIAKKLGVTKQEMVEKTEPMQAIYAIVDHARTLSFAISDNGIPSNVGGGYNLRVILRRALGFIDKYEMPFDMYWACEQVSKYFKPAHPELVNNLKKIKEIINVEEKRFNESKVKIKRTIESLIEKETKFTDKKMVELYDSFGITPELINEVAEENNIKLKVSSDFYSKVAEKHSKEKTKDTLIDINLDGIKETEKLYRKDEKKKKFKAKVLKSYGEYVVLDKTCFYPRGGGQEPDLGTLGGNKVYDVESIDNYIIHFVSGNNFKEGDVVQGNINWDRRWKIMQHHSATHLIVKAARDVVGEWIWQAGSKKDEDKAHIDLTHYQALTEDQINKIEKIANSFIKRKIKFKKSEMERIKAEKKFGFGIYQGAAVPCKTLRIVEIPKVDVEACGGTHVDNTKEIKNIIIYKTERPMDGTVRLFYKAGESATEYEKQIEETVNKTSKLLGVKEEDLPRAVKKLFGKWKKTRKELKENLKDAAEKTIADLTFNEIEDIRILVQKIPDANLSKLQKISKSLSQNNTLIILFGVEGKKIFVFGSAGKEVISRGVAVGNIVSEVCKELGGKGGGRDNLAQGVGSNLKDLDNVIEILKERIVK